MNYAGWLALGGLLVVAEAFVSGFVLLWFGLAALVTGGLVFIMPDLSWQPQTVCFAVLSLASLAVWFVFKSKFEAPNDQPNLNQRGLVNIGKIVEIQTPIKNGSGSVRLGDTVWSAKGPDAPAGEKMKVTGAEGAVLIVEHHHD